MAALVSIIIPCYNAEKYIAETISSALAQTYQPIEIIVIDDGSSDKSLNVVRQFSSGHIFIYQQKNSGASIARNKGLEMAKGKYIQFLDADDIISPNKIEVQVNILESRANHISLCHTVHFKDGTNPLSYPIIHEWFKEGSENTTDFLIKLYGGPLIANDLGGMIQPNAWLTPKHLIDKAGLWNEMRSPDDDGEFFCRVLLHAEGIAYTLQGVNYYRKFENISTLSSQNNKQSFAAVLKSTELKAKHLISKTDDPNAKLAVSRLFWELASNAYPNYPSISKKAILAATNYSSHKPRYLYTYTKFYTLISKYFGWKTSAWISYLKQKLMKHLTIQRG